MGLLDYRNRSPFKALIELHPELKLKKEIFFRSKVGWKDPANQRNFYDTFARTKKFDPLDAEKWYSVTYNEIIRFGGKGLLDYYNGSHIKALMKLYPELVLKKENFFKSNKGWKASENQRKFFDGFAKSQKFNPLDAEKWYSVTHNEIIRAGGGTLLNYYNGSHIKALVKLYPELMLKRMKFFKSKGVWKEGCRRKQEE